MDSAQFADEDAMQTCPYAHSAEMTAWFLDNSAMSTHTYIRPQCGRCATTKPLLLSSPAERPTPTGLWRGALERRISVKAAGARGARGPRGLGCTFVSASVCTACSTPSAWTEPFSFSNVRGDVGMAPGLLAVSTT